MFICGLLLAGSLAGLIAMIPPPKSEEPQRKTAIAAVAAVQALRRGFDLPPAGESRYVQNEVLLDIPATVPTTTLDRIATRHHMTRVETTTIELTGRTLHRWRIEDGRSVRAVIMRLSRERVIAGAGANYLYSLDQEPARHGQPSYAARKLNLGEAHALATGAKIRIALIDSGVDATHPDIASAIIGSFDTLDDDKLHPHGTAMAGAIVSIAPRVELLSVRVFSARATATTLGILLGLDWAAQRGAHIVNMSFTGPPDPRLRDALRKASQKGMVLIAAAGNAGPRSPPLFPAADPQMIAVTATDLDDRLFGNANRGDYIAVAAPGVDILAPAPNKAYQLVTGTSIAAAEVSGVAALLIERNPRLTQAAMRKVLMDTARDLGPKGRDREFGAGLVNALRAILSLW
jgi:subtilisin family serine protease